jgi:hypothetical protein
MRALVAPALLLVFGVPLTWIAVLLVLSGSGQVTGIVTDADGRPVGACAIHERHRLWRAGDTAELAVIRRDGTFKLSAPGGWNRLTAACPDGRASDETNVVAFWRDVGGQRLRAK